MQWPALRIFMQRKFMNESSAGLSISCPGELVRQLIEWLYREKPLLPEELENCQ